MKQDTPKAPKLRFKNKDNLNFPDLEIHSLGKIAKFKKGKGISKLDINPLGDYKCIRYGELFTIYDENIKEVVSNTEINPSRMVLSEGNEVLMPTSDVTPRGLATASALSLKNIIIGGDILIISSDKINNLYLAYYIRFNKKQIMRLVSGVTVYHIYSSDLNSFKINLPSLEEQKEISDFLETVDNYIENLKSQKEELEKYKKGMMQKMFSQQIRFKDENGNNFPTWKKLKIKDLFNHIGGTALEKFVSNKGDYKFVSIGNYSTEGKYIDDGKRVTLNDKTKTKKLEKDNLVMVLNDKSTTGELIGATILIDSDNYIYNQRSERLICNENCFPRFMWYLLNSSTIRKTIYKLSQGGTQIYINYGTIENIEMNLPSLHEQQKISIYLENIDKNILIRNEQIIKTQEWKNGLMQKMFI